MNYPIKIKKTFSKMRYQVQDVWQNLRLLKRHISCLVRSIDDLGSGVNRSRQLLQNIYLSQTESGSAHIANRDQARENCTAGAFR